MKTQKIPLIFHRDVQLDAILVQAALHNIYPLILSAFRMTPNEGRARWAWMVRQKEYMKQVQEMVENFDVNKRKTQSRR